MVRQNGIEFDEFLIFMLFCYSEAVGESTYEASNTGLIVGIALGVTAIVCTGAVLLMFMHSRRESVATARKKSEGLYKIHHFVICNIYVQIKYAVRSESKSSQHL